MDIYLILASKPHNPHYLKRYVKFIEKCQEKNTNYKGYFESHHICPKAKDMFPEYKSFKQYPWNLVKLTARQHFIAHLILWKVYRDIYSVSASVWSMKHKNNMSINSRLYKALKERFYVGELSGNNKGKFWVTNGENNMMIFNDENIPTGYYKGKTQSKNSLTVSGTIFINNGLETKRIGGNETIPNGWKKGISKNKLKPFKYITDGFITRKINPKDPIPNGFRCGMAPRKKKAAIN